MTVNPQLLRAERHGTVGHVIRRDADAIIERWAGRAVEEQPQAVRLHHSSLLDHLPHLLNSVGKSLAESVDDDDLPHREPARTHGEQRWQEGWSLTEVVRDYQILRLVIFEHLDHALERPLSTREVQAVGLALDEATSASVAAYVRQRDEHTARIEASLSAQANELREADRRKNEFLAVLAHELRNPLAPILNSMEVLRLLGPADNNAVQARDIIERQVRQLARLVDDLLDVTRIAQGKVELRRTSFDVATAVAEAVHMTTPLVQAQEHRLAVHLPDEPLTLHADQARVVQVLVNLLNNAAKYTDPGGRIELSATRQGDEAVLRVSDNGVGIEPEMLARVFDLFTQVGRSVARSQGGLGIGLTLVRQLVELHGGRVGAASGGPGKGSEFEVRLPLARKAEDAALPPPPVRVTRGLHILVIEDLADARSALKQLLELLGHRVDVADNGPDGIARAVAERPRVALIDLGLPGMDGCAVAKNLRERLGGDVRLVALTGHALEEDRRRTAEAGFDAHLVKPVDVSELTRVLQPEAAL